MSLEMATQKEHRPGATRQPASEGVRRSNEKKSKETRCNQAAVQAHGRETEATEASWRGARSRQERS